MLLNSRANSRYKNEIWLQYLFDYAAYISYIGQEMVKKSAVLQKHKFPSPSKRALIMMLFV